tara:strand:+ start:140 stop:316 length:177 start_codon:yes stop_codon:yes gene_type:complete
MASFLLGILCGMAIEECCRFMARKCDKAMKKMEALPDVVPADADEGTNEIQSLSSKNN